MMEDVYLPLGVNDTSFTLYGPLQRERIVPVVIVRDQTPGIFDPSLIEAMNFLSNEEMELPAGGGVSPTAHDIFLFSEMLRRGGKLERSADTESRDDKAFCHDKPDRDDGQPLARTTCARCTGGPSIRPIWGSAFS